MVRRAFLSGMKKRQAVALLHLPVDLLRDVVCAKFQLARVMAPRLQYCA